MSADRFALEDAISGVYCAIDDLHLLAEQAEQDQAVQVIRSIANVHALRCNKLTEVFEAMVEAGQFR